MEHLFTKIPNHEIPDNYNAKQTYVGTLADAMSMCIGDSTCVAIVRPANVSDMDDTIIKYD